MLDKLTSALLPCSELVSGFLLAIAPAWILLGIDRNERVALFVKSESLVLLSLCYALRYQDVWSNLFSSNLLFEKIQLVATPLAAWKVMVHERNLDLNRLEVDEDSVGDTESKTSFEDLKAAMLKKGQGLALTSWSELRPLVLGSIVTSLYAGKSSAVYYFSRWSDNKPIPNFMTALSQNLMVLATVFELNGLLFQHLLTIPLRRLALSLPLRGADDGGDIKTSARMPTAVWLYLLSLQIGSSAVLPSLWQEYRAGVETNDDIGLRLLMNLMASGFFILSMLGMAMFPLKKLNVSAKDVKKVKASSKHVKKDGAIRL